MCIAAFTLGGGTDYALVFAANRDELHARPTAAADWWPDAATILGGRDLVAGGSWLAMDRAGRLAAVTNLPQDRSRQFPHSRGELVRDFLTAGQAGAEFVAALAGRAADYAPFNFIAFDGDAFHYLGTGTAPQRLPPGIHALSNAVLGTDWPKIRRARTGLRASLGAGDPTEALLDLLATGADIDCDADGRRQTAVFINDPQHGTRSSTVILVTSDGRVRFTERSFAAAGRAAGDRVHTFTLDA